MAEASICGSSRPVSSLPLQGGPRTLSPLPEQVHLEVTVESDSCSCTGTCGPNRCRQAAGCRGWCVTTQGLQADSLSDQARAPRAFESPPLPTARSTARASLRLPGARTTRP